MTKSNVMFLLIGISLICLSISITGNTNLLGALVGYTLSFLCIQMLYRDTIRSMELDLEMVLSQMRRSFVTRWGIITLAVVAVGRYKADWLLTLAIGIAIGLLVSLLIGVNEILKERKG